MDKSRQAVLSCAIVLVFLGLAGGGLWFASRYMIDKMSGFTRDLHEVTYYPVHIPSGKDARTQAELDKALHKFFLRNTVEVYKKSGRRSPKWDTAAIRFLEEYVTAQTPGIPGVSKQKLYQDARAAIDAGCNDPLVMGLAGVTYFKNDAVEEGAPLLRKALVALENGPYKKSVAVIVPESLIPLHEGSPSLCSENEQEEATSAYIRWMKESLDDGGFLPGEDRVAVNALLPTTPFLDSGVLHGRWRDASPDSKGENLVYARKTLHGLFYKEAAIDERWSEDTKLSLAVNNKFRSDLGAVTKELTEAWESHPDYPEAPSIMMSVSASLRKAGPKAPFMWFDRTVAAQMDYKPAYDYMLHHLNDEDMTAMEKFAKACLDTNRYDTDVPAFYLRMASAGRADYRGLWHRKDVQANLLSMCDGYMKSQHGGTPAHWASVKASVYWYTSRFPEAYKEMARLGDNLDKSVFTEFFGYDHEDAIATCYLGGGKFATEIKGIEALRSAGKYEEARKAYKRLQNTKGVEKPILKFIADMLQSISIREELDKGHWITLKPSKDLYMWGKYPNSPWTVQPDGSLYGRSWDGRACLYSHLKLGDRWQMTFDVEPIKSLNNDPWVGIMWGGRRENTAVTIKNSERKVRVSGSREHEIGSYSYVPVQKVDHLDIRDFDGRLRVAVNGRLLDGETNVPKDELNSLGFFGADFDNETAVIYRNIRIRELRKESDLDAPAQ